MSTTNTSVSVPLMPACVLPVLPYPSAGGTISITRLPTVWPTRPLSQPVMTWLGVAPMVKPNGSPRDQDESNTLPVRQIEPTYWVTTVWPLATTGPEPLISVLVIRPDGGLCDGILMTGAAPDFAVTV